MTEDHIKILQFLSTGEDLKLADAILNLEEGIDWTALVDGLVRQGYLTHGVVKKSSRGDNKPIIYFECNLTEKGSKFLKDHSKDK